MLTPADPTSALALCVRLAAQRGRELRALREREPALTVEDQADDESAFVGAVRQAGADDDTP